MDIKETTIEELLATAEARADVREFLRRGFYAGDYLVAARAVERAAETAEKACDNVIAQRREQIIQLTRMEEEFEPLKRELPNINARLNANPKDDGLQARYWEAQDQQKAINELIAVVDTMPARCEELRLKAEAWGLLSRVARIIVGELLPDDTLEHLLPEYKREEFRQGRQREAEAKARAEAEREAGALARKAREEEAKRKEAEERAEIPELCARYFFGSTLEAVQDALVQNGPRRNHGLMALDGELGRTPLYHPKRRAIERIVEALPGYTNMGPVALPIQHIVEYLRSAQQIDSEFTWSLE